MMFEHYPTKIEKSFRHGKAMCVTCAVVFIFNAAPLLAGGEGRERGPRAVAMGGAAVAVSGTADAALQNPAMLPAAMRGGMLCWTPGRFGFTELGSVAAGWVQPFGAVTASVDVQRFGYDSYAEHRLGTAAGLRLSERLFAGARLSLLHIGIERYGSTLLPLLDVGAGIIIADSLQVAAVANAVNMPSAAEDERIPATLTAGLAWRHEGLLLALDLEKETRHDLNIRGGVEYRMLGILLLRCGISTVTRQWSVGFGIERGPFRISYALALHSELGATHAIGIGFEP